MGIKDYYMDYQRQRTVIAAHDFSCFSLATTAVGQGGVGGSGTIDEHGAGAVLQTLNRNIVAGGDGSASADGTVITSGSANGFANVEVGDIIGYGDTSPDLRIVTAQASNTVTVFALKTALRNTTAQDYNVYRRMGMSGAHYSAAGQWVRHLMPIPSHWDTHDDLGVDLHFTAQGAAGYDSMTWRVTYDVVSEGELLTHGPHYILGSVSYSWDPTHDDCTLAVRDIPNKIPASELDKGDWISLLVELQATDMTLGQDNRREAAYLCGIGLEWTPKLTVGRGADARPYAITRRDKW